MKIVFILIILAILTIGIVVFNIYDEKSGQQLGDMSIYDKNQKISDQKIPKPDNFIQIRRDVQKGVFYDLENLSKEYYLQPDFYPSYKANSSGHDYTRWGVHGYGAYPGEISYNIKDFEKGQYVSIFTFVKASEDIETFQGMKFNYDISYNQNAGDQYNDGLFDVYVNPNTVMFSPTFPERSEYVIGPRIYDWAYKLETTIVAKSSIPPGIYKFKLETSPPDDAIQKLYYEDIQKINQVWYKCPGNDDRCSNNIVELRKRVYVNGGQFQADKFFNIVINVK